MVFSLSVNPEETDGDLQFVTFCDGGDFSSDGYLYTIFEISGVLEYSPLKK